MSAYLVNAFKKPVWPLVGAALLSFGCAGDDPAGPDNTAPPVEGTAGDPPAPPADAPSTGTGDETPTDTPPANDAPVAETPASETPTDGALEVQAELAEVLSGQLAPRDLVFGPADTDFADELFVVNFASAEAVWVVDFETPEQSIGTVQSSLVGAIAVDAGNDGRFYFACLLPVMGANVGVVTVRTIDENVPDFQYEGVMTPTGVALDAEGGLFVANRDRGSIVRIDFADGRDRDRHTVSTVAQNLAFGVDDLPNHMLVAPDGRLLVCETAADRIQVWDAENGLEVFAGAEFGLDRPVGIARRPDGNILVSNHGSGEIVELTADGSFVRLIDTGLGDGALYGIEVRADNRVYVIGGRSLYRVDGI